MDAKHWVRRCVEQARRPYDSSEQLAGAAWAWALYYGPTFGTPSYSECLVAAKAVLR
jgi:hypothetical protein